MSRPRTITSFASISTRPARIATPLQSQLLRRWASSEAEAKDLPISELQPTPEEEVENAIQEDKAPEQASAGEAQAHQSSQAPQADVASDSMEQAAVNNAVDSHSPVSELTQGFERESRQPGRQSGRQDRQFDGQDRRPARDPPTPKPTIFVGNLFFDVTEGDLEKEFARFGTIKNLRLIKDVRGLSKG